MTDKKRIKNGLRQLQKIKTWQLVIIFILMSFLAATFLRLNNIGMIERRKAVLVADEIGDNEITQNRLYDLQRFIVDHMNTDLGKGIYLEASYKRDAQIAYEEAAKDSNPSGNIYQKAQEVCAPQFTNWSYAYIQCTTVELAKYPSAGDLLNSVNLPKADAYLHSFISPVWSPDFAGWSVLICVVILLMILTRLTSVIVLKMLLRYRYKNI